MNNEFKRQLLSCVKDNNKYLAQQLEYELQWHDCPYIAVCEGDVKDSLERLDHFDITHKLTDEDYDRIADIMSDEILESDIFVDTLDKAVAKFLEEREQQD